MYSNKHFIIFYNHVYLFSNKKQYSITVSNIKKKKFNMKKVIDNCIKWKDHLNIQPSNNIATKLDNIE